MTLSVLVGGLSAAGGTLFLHPGQSTGGGSAQVDALALTAQDPLGRTPGGSVTPTSPSTTSAAPSSTEAAKPETSEAAKPTTSDAPAPTTSSKEDSPASSSPTPAAKSAPTLAGQIVNLVNDERGKAGCGPVTEESHLDRAAQGHSDDMSERDYFSHDTPEGDSFADRITAAGYSRPGAENIAKGAASADQVMRMWMNSSGHRANILNCSLKKLGVGVAKDGWYWTQDFGY